MHPALLVRGVGERALQLLQLNVALQVIGAAFGLGGQWFINRQDPLGFVCWIISNVALIWLQLRVRMFVLFALHLVYLGLSIDGLARWGWA